MCTECFVLCPIYLPYQPRGSALLRRILSHKYNDGIQCVEGPVCTVTADLFLHRFY